VGVTTQGSGGETPEAVDQRGFGVGAPDAEEFFYIFFPKKYAFLSLLWS